MCMAASIEELGPSLNPSQSESSIEVSRTKKLEKLLVFNNMFLIIIVD